MGSSSLKSAGLTEIGTSSGGARLRGRGNHLPGDGVEGRFDAFEFGFILHRSAIAFLTARASSHSSYVSTSPVSHCLTVPLGERTQKPPLQRGPSSTSTGIGPSVAI